MHTLSIHGASDVSFWAAYSPHAGHCVVLRVASRLGDMDVHIYDLPEEARLKLVSILGEPIRDWRELTSTQSAMEARHDDADE